MNMQRVKIYILLLGVIFISASAIAQNGTSSPFSRTAYGDLNDNVPNTYRAMGGVGIGMRSNKVICTMQPASYTAGDSLTFMFDLGASVMWSRYQDDAGVKNKANGNLEYIAMQFPLYKRYVGMSVGVLPYSAVGYNITLMDSTSTPYHGIKNYWGEGGISEVYGGLSINLFDWVALGANIYYMFGNVANTSSISFTEPGLSSVTMANALKVNSIRFRYGIQIFHTFEKHSFTIGGIFENKRKLNSEYGEIESTLLDSVYLSTEDPNFHAELPMQYGGGLSYTYDQRLTIAMDYLKQCFGAVSYMTEGAGVLRDRTKYSFGMEYRHNPYGRKYVERIQWRVGAYMADSYVKSISTPDFGVSMGVGFPLRNAGTVFNTTLEYGHRGELTGMQENYLRMTLNAAISENWFFKRKL